MEKGLQMREKVISCVVENDRLVLRGFSDTEECLLRRFLQQIIGNINSIPEYTDAQSQEKENLTSD